MSRRRQLRSQLWNRVELAQARVETGRLANMQPLLEEEGSVALALDTRRAAMAVAQPVLNPPTCILGQIIGDEQNARGALRPSAAKSTLTRDSRARWAREQQERRGTPGLLAAIRAIA